MKALKELRVAKNLTQEQIAKSIGIPTRNYCNYENGTREADYDTLLKLSSFFDVSINQLLGEKNEDIILVNKKEFESLELIKGLAKVIDEIEKKNGL